MKDLLIVIGVMSLLLAGSWLVTMIIIKLITLCFGWGFSWWIATGIWLLMFIIKACFTSNK